MLSLRKLVEMRIDAQAHYLYGFTITELSHSALAVNSV
jgi:hypothetical protein